MTEIPSRSGPYQSRHNRGGLWTLGNWFLAFMLLLGVVIFALLGTPLGHSYGFNMSWAVAFSEAFGGYSLYPRHLPALWDGMGGLDFFFYGPLPFYVVVGPAQLLCPGCSPQVVFGLSGGLIWAGSALTFRLFAGRLMPAMPATIAAVFWALMPYHVGVDWIVRQAAGEFAAYLFLPLVGHGILVAIEDKRAGWSLPVGVAGLALCHLPTVLLTTHVLTVIVLVWVVQNPREMRRVLPLLVLQATAGLALAALYWLPALVLLEDVSPGGLYPRELSAPAWYLIGPGILPDSLYRVALFLCQVAGVCMAGAAVFCAPKVWRGWLVLWALLPALIVVLLNTSLTAPLWENWIISKVQFPFRLTVFSDWSAALAAGVLATTVMQSGASVRRVVAAGGLASLLLAGLATGALLPKRVMDGWAERGVEVHMIGAPEYLPPGVFGPLERSDRPVWEMPGRIMGLVARSQAPEAGLLQPDLIAPRTWQFPAIEGEAALVRTTLPFWRHLVAETRSGTPVALTADPETGLAQFVHPDRAEAVLIRLPWHWSERLGAVLSVLGLVGVAASILIGRRAAADLKI